MTDLKTMMAALPEDARTPLDLWIRELRSELGDLPTATANEVAEEVVAHVAHSLIAGADAAAVTQALGEFGTPPEYAAAVRDAVGDGTEFRVPVTGRVLGMPYELRLPTTARVRSRWWDTSSSKILVPKVFGVGWTINLGGLAVRMGLLHADDGDEPFESVPDNRMWIAFAVPTALLMAFVGIWAVKHGAASPQVPSHWGPSGAADGWSSKNTMLAITSVAVLAPYAWAVWGYLTRDTRFNRIIICAFAASIEVIGVTIYALSIFEVQMANPVALGVGILLPILAIPFAMLVGFARVGMSQVMNRG